MTNLVPHETIASKIYNLRKKKIMLDNDLAKLYGIETKTLNRALKRNLDRFPADFMFQLSRKEHEDLRCQIGTSSYGGRRYLPYAFTEHGILMLSSILNSSRAIQVNIQIVRAFTRLREMLATHIELKHAVENLERHVSKHDRQIQTAFEAIRQILEPPAAPKRKIGFIR